MKTGKGLVYKISIPIAAIILVFLVIGGVTQASADKNEPFLAKAGLEFGIVCNYMNQTSDMETNFAVLKYQGNGHTNGNTIAENRANAAGRILAGEIIGEKRFRYDPLVIEGKEVAAEVREMLASIQSYSSSVIDKEDYVTPAEVKDQNSYVVDISEIDKKTVYVNAENMVNAWNAGKIQNGGIKVKMRENQTIVFNVKEEKQFEIPRYSVKITDGKKSNVELAQTVIWNMPNLVKLALSSDGMRATVIAPMAYVNLNVTGEGWLVCDTIVNNSGEWHMIYKDVPKVTDKPKATKTPKPTEKPKATDTPKPTEKPKVTDMPKPTETPEPMAVETPKNIKAPTPTPEETEAPTATSEVTEVPEPTGTPEPMSIETPKNIKAPTPTPEETEAPTATPEVTETPKAEITPEPTRPPFVPPTPMPTETPKAEITPEPTRPPFVPPTPLPTETPEAEDTPEPMAVETPKNIKAPTPTPEETEAPTATPMPTETPKAEVTPEPTRPPFVPPTPLPTETPEAEETPEPMAIETPKNIKAPTLTPEETEAPTATLEAKETPVVTTKGEEPTTPPSGTETPKAEVTPEPTRPPFMPPTPIPTETSKAEETPEPMAIETPENIQAPTATPGITGAPTAAPGLTEAPAVTPNEEEPTMPPSGTETPEAEGTPAVEDTPEPTQPPFMPPTPLPAETPGTLDGFTEEPEMTVTPESTQLPFAPAKIGSTSSDATEPPLTTVENEKPPLANKEVKKKSNNTTILDDKVPLSDSAPQTGDSTNLLFPVLAMGLSFLVLVGIMVFRRKRN